MLNQRVWRWCRVVWKRGDAGSWGMLFGKAPPVARLGRERTVGGTDATAAPRCPSALFSYCSPWELMSILWTREGKRSGINIFLSLSYKSNFFGWASDGKKFSSCAQWAPLSYKQQREAEHEMQTPARTSAVSVDITSCFALHFLALRFSSA